MGRLYEDISISNIPFRLYPINSKNTYVVRIAYIGTTAMIKMRNHNG